MKKSPIGIIDSGVGGLTILLEITKKLPSESFIYLADQKNLPYGTKNKKEIYRLSKKLVKFLIAKKAKLIVIACNTITVACIDKLRKDFPDIPIIGTVPVVKTASKLTKNGRIGILSTKQTASSKYQKDLIKKFAKGLKVLNLGTDKLVPLIEASETATFPRDTRREIERGPVKGFPPASAPVDSAQMRAVGIPSTLATPSEILTKDLKPFKDFKIDVLVLGCSHFPLLKSEMRKILGSKIKILDSGGAIARQTKRILVSENLEAEYNKSVKKFYTTGEMKEFNDFKFEKINI